MSKVRPAAPVAIAPGSALWGKRLRPNTKFWMSALTVLGIGLLAIGKFDGATHSLQRLTSADAKRQVATYSIGDCVTLAGSGAEPEISKASCGTDPSYTVGSIVQADAACPDPNYTRYLWAVGDKTIGTLCLAHNLLVDHCYQPGTGGKTLEVVQCTVVTEKGEKVVERLDNVSDVTQCPPNTTAFAYPTPTRTYCVITPNPPQRYS